MMHMTYRGPSSLRVVVEECAIVAECQEKARHPTWTASLLAFSGNFVNLDSFSCVVLIKEPFMITLKIELSMSIM